ncbi:sensor histidine kinase [Nocardioides alcanivorans]|uniref:sensor histidine kinase n=1 Tax=Nocardioides alcanivorans TaxID=2897352 RepID=UPI001F426EAB|nr:HAMP domain-containing sensor histidine kinase [Nocardioides alcanivorans]
MIGPEAMTSLSATAQLCFTVSMIGGALLLLVPWRYRDEDCSAWVAFGLMTVGVYLLPQSYLPTDAPRWDSRISPVDFLVMLVLVLAVRAAWRGRAPIAWCHPLFLGLGAGLALSGLRLLVGWSLVTPDPPWVVVLVSVCFVLTVLVCGVFVINLSWLPTPYAWHLMIGVALGIGYHHFLAVSSYPVTLPATAGAVISTIATFQILASCLALTHDAHQEQLLRLTELAERAQRAEDVVEHDAELLHEARATIAGLSTASHLLATEAHRLERVQVTALQSMVDSEMIRLQAILGAHHASADTEAWVALDEVLDPLVISLRTQGCDVDIRPSGLTVWSDREILTTAVHVLLCNSKRHAPGARIKIWSTRLATSVVLHVADDGPGLPEGLTEHLFNRGAHGTDSTGQGLGLHAARKGLRAHGADLRLIPSPRGARFAVILPLAAECSA